MISKKIGTILNTNSKNKIWWVKLGIALILSNIFFFFLFSNERPPEKSSDSIPKGMVEIQLNAELQTPFQKGKRILLINRFFKKQLEAVLQAEREGRFEVIVKEEDAPVLFQHDSWEILPYMKNLFKKTVKSNGVQHEILY
ncbi:MAG: hypothetical protein AB7I27_16140 [Bacteriovoracaceae bacterium]